MNQEKLSEFLSKRIAYNHIKYSEITPYVIESHCHDAFEIIYLKKGDLTYNLEGKKYHLRNNSLIITRPFLAHSITVNSPVYERYDFIFENNIIKDSVVNKLPANIDVVNLNDYPEITTIFTKTDRYFQHFRDDELKEILSDTVKELFYNIIMISGDFTENSKYSSNPVIASAVNFISSNLSSPFTIEDVCKTLFISKSYLHRLFLQHMQITPQKYITEKRLLMAQKEIRTMKKPTDIFETCGFSDYSSFYRAYKKYFGYPPSEELNHEIVRTIEF